MTESVIVALISGGLAFLGTVVTIVATTRKTEENFQINQSVMQTKLEELTREVREHNGFARTIPLLEQRIEQIEGRIEHLEHSKDI